MDLGHYSNRAGDLMNSIIETPLVHFLLFTTILLRAPLPATRASDPKILNL